MKHFFNILLLVVSGYCIVSYADNLNSLTLTDSEMQKLKYFFPTEENTHLVWQGNPLQVHLPIDKEKRLIFTESVTVDVKGALSNDQLRIINNDKSIYLTALKDFSPTRIYVTLQNGIVIMIDLNTNNTASGIAQFIDVKQEESTLAPNNHRDKISDKSEPLTYVDLIRFAYQELYAPTRFLEYLTPYLRVPMHTEIFTSNLIYGDKVIVHPVASWNAGNYYVTAVALQNKYKHRTHINIRKDLCGDWLAATLYPRATLESHGDTLHDSATLFLVSRGTFSETIGVCYGNA